MRSIHLALLLFLMPITYALQFSEIMYRPAFNENYNEWIELHNDGNDAVPIDNLTLCGKRILPGYIINNSNGKVYSNNTAIIPGDAYAVITDGGSGTDAYSNYQILGIALHTESSTLCGGLNNSIKNIYISQNGIVLDNITYLPNAIMNHSISRRDVSGGVSFDDSFPTPGSINEFSDTPNSNNNQTNDTINSNSFIDQSNGEDNAVNETDIGQSDDANDDPGACDWKISVIDENAGSAAEKLALKIKAERIRGTKTNLTARVDLISSDDAVIKRYILYQDHEATYSKTSYIKNSDISGDIRVRAELISACDDADLRNNIAEISANVLGDSDADVDGDGRNISDRMRKSSKINRSERIQDSSLVIDASDKKVTLFLYRGNTSKYAVHATLIYDGKRSDYSLHLNDKFSEFELSISNEACIRNRTIILDGLGEHEETSFILNSTSQGNDCADSIAGNQDSISEQPDVAATRAAGTSVNLAKNQLTGDSISSGKDSEKRIVMNGFDQRKIGFTMLLVLSMILNVVLVWRR